MHRFYLSPEQCRSSELKLTSREAHHAVHVLKVGRGERLVVLDGAGSEILCEAHDHARGALPLTVISRALIPPLPYHITLLQAIPKGKTFETIIQKATELGTWRIVPILSERTITHPDEKGASSKSGKWRNVAIEAIKQCGNPWLPHIEKPVTPADFISHGEKFDLRLVGSLQGDRRHPREYLQAFLSEHGKLPQTVCVWIGPEGDFTPAELDTIKASGALPITLGQIILRSDTAAIYCLSFLNYELQSPPHV
jgi:16S rRNA (uracil1498-N3)-methyltransferase